MRTRTLAVCAIVVPALVLLLATAVFSGAPYRWPHDNDGDPSRQGDEANGWEYWVDYYDPVMAWIEPMEWCPYDERWEDPYGLCGPDAAWVGPVPGGWKIVAQELGGMAVNPKLAGFRHAEPTV